MDINAYIDNQKIKHILVNGEAHCREKIDKLLAVIDNQDAQGLSITFFDANMLHLDIVEKIHTTQKIKFCRIYTFRMHLYSYLYNLGIKCEYIRSKQLKAYHKLNPQNDIRLTGELNAFLKELFEQYGYDYTRYHENSIMRRIKVCMIKENMDSFKDFRKAVLKDYRLFEQLFQDFSINTTEFFRDPEVFLAIRNKILPYLSSSLHIKIWCGGCSSGKEAYSIAILLHELGILEKAQIYATDINPFVIGEAKNGLYPIEDITKMILNYKAAGGEKELTDYFEVQEKYFKIKDYLKKNILFFQHSLTENGSLNEFELILCRNVMIYFNADLQNSVLQNFYHSLDPNGFLVIGKSEGMLLNGGKRYFRKYMLNEKIFKRK